MSEPGAPQLRLATVADLPRLRELIPASVRGLAPGYYTAQQIESSIVHMFGPDSQLIADGTYFEIEVDGRLAACGGWSRRKTLFGGDQTKGAEEREVDGDEGDGGGRSLT